MKTKTYFLEIDDEQRDLIVYALSELQLCTCSGLMEEEKDDLLQHFLKCGDNYSGDYAIKFRKGVEEQPVSLINELIKLKSDLVKLV